MSGQSGSVEDSPAWERRPTLPAAAPGQASVVGFSDGSRSVLVPRQQLAEIRRYYNAVKDAYFNYGQTDGDADEVVRRLFDLTPELLGGAANPAGETPLGVAIARQSWKAAERLLALAEGQNPCGLRCRTTPAGEADALVLAVGADPPADEVVLRRLVRHLLDDVQAGVASEGNGRNALHAASEAAAAGRPIALEIVLNELAALLAESSSQTLADRLTGALNARDSEGCSPLHRMARGNQAGAMRTVLDLAEQHGLRPDWDARQTGGRGLTPLALAAEAGALEVCDLLLSRRLAAVEFSVGAGRAPDWTQQQRDLWLRASPSDAARRLLGRHCRRLLEPLADVPEAARRQLLDGLRERGLEEKFAHGLRSRCQCMPPSSDGNDGPPSGLGQLGDCCSAARLAAWDVLQRLGEPDLARLLEGDPEQQKT